MNATTRERRSDGFGHVMAALHGSCPKRTPQWTGQNFAATRLGVPGTPSTIGVEKTN